MKNIFEFLIIGIVISIITFLTALFYSFIFSLMWVWYITPVFGVAVPKLYMLYGLLITSMLIFNGQSIDKLFDGIDKKNSIIDIIYIISDLINSVTLRKIIFGLIVLLLGWTNHTMFV